MPNHVTTRVVITGQKDRIDEFKKKHIITDVEDGREPETCLDLGTIVPKPKILDETESSTDTELGIAALTGQEVFGKYFPRSVLDDHRVKAAGVTNMAEYAEWLKKENPRAYKLGELALKAKKETGHYDWYTWSVEKWGTKWNAYQYEEVRNDYEEFEFTFVLLTKAGNSLCKATTAKRPNFLKSKQRTLSIKKCTVKRLIMRMTRKKKQNCYLHLIL